MSPFCQGSPYAASAGTYDEQEVSQTISPILLEDKIRDWQGGDPVTAVRALQDGDGVICAICNERFHERPAFRYCACCNYSKVNAELSRTHCFEEHARPFVCKYRGCTEREGFANIEDLDFHTLWNHSPMIADLSLNFPPSAYSCWNDECQGRVVWTDRDEFRSHLNTWHQLEGLELDEALRK